MLNEMQYVYAVYKEKSFSKAAKKLFISQPALSAMVKKAEKEIGCPIFDRGTIPLTVTKDGEYYINGIEQILLAKRNVEEYFEDLSALKGGSLSIGGSSFFCAYVLADLFGRFRAKHPGVAIDILEGNIKELRQGLEDETLDLIIETAISMEDQSVERYLYGYEYIVLAVPASYPVNKRLQPYQLLFRDVCNDKYLDAAVPAVPLEHFKDTPFLIMKKGNDMHRRSMSICKKAGFVPRAAIHLDQILTSFNIACTGVGAVFIRANILKYMQENNALVYYKIGDPLARRPILIAVKKGRYISHATREFLSMAGAKKVGTEKTTRMSISIDT